MNKLLPLMAAFCMTVSLPALAAMGTGDKADKAEKADRYFQKMDTNSDGKISKSEHDAYGQKMFSESDANRDNMLTREEIQANKMKEREAMKTSRSTMRDEDYRPSAGAGVDRNTSGADNVEYPKGASSLGETPASRTGQMNASGEMARDRESR
jgi:hypothetical protein